MQPSIKVWSILKLLISFQHHLQVHRYGAGEAQAKVKGWQSNGGDECPGETPSDRQGLGNHDVVGYADGWSRYSQFYYYFSISLLC